MATEITIRAVLPGDNLLDTAEAAADLAKQPCKEAGFNFLVVITVGGSGKYLNRVDEFGDAAGGAARALVPISREERDALRAAARDIWQARTGRRAIWDGLDVHHRIPLEWSHLFPNADPNRIANLIGMTPADHTQVTNAWNAWRQSLNGRIPTQAEVVQQAIRIDEQFAHLMHFLP